MFLGQLERSYCGAILVAYLKNYKQRFCLTSWSHREDAGHQMVNNF